MLFTIAGSFLCMGVLYLLTGGMATETASVVFYSGSYAFSTYYINLSIFLAFAATYPDMQVLLMFVIPVKVKWMGILDAILMVYTVIAGNLFTKFAVVASLLNFVLYFYRLHRSRISPKQMHRKAQFERKIPMLDGRKSQDTNVPSVDGQKRTIRIWSSVSAPNVTATTNIASIIYLPMST